MTDIPFNFRANGADRVASDIAEINKALKAGEKEAAAASKAARDLAKGFDQLSKTRVNQTLKESGVLVDELRKKYTGLSDDALNKVQQKLSKLSDSSGITNLAKALDTNFTSAQKFAQAIGLSGTQAEQAIRKLRSLNEVNATTQQKFDALNRELGINADQYQALEKAVADYDQKQEQVARGLKEQAEEAERLAKELKELDAQQGKTGSGLQQILKGVLQGVGQAAFQLVVDGLRAAATAFVELGQAALDANKAFDTAAAAVSTLSNEGDTVAASLQGITDDLKNQASSTDLLGAAYDVLSSKTASLTEGLTDAQLATEILEAATKGAVGGFSDTATVSDALTSALNAYGVSASNAAAFTDQLIQTQNLGKITVGEYAQQIGRVVPIAAQAGLSFEELNAAIATVTSQGVNSESAVSGVRQAIVNLLKPTADAQKVLEQYGITNAAATLKSEGLIGVLKQIGNVPTDTLSKIFTDVDALTAVAPLVGQLEQFESNIQSIGNSAGAADAAFNKVADSLQGRLTAATNVYNDALVQLGQSLEPVQRSLLGTFLDTAEIVGENSRAFEIITDAADRFAETLEGNPEAVDALGESLSKIADILASGIANGIDAFAAGLTDPLFGQFVETLSSGLEFIGSLLNVVGNVLGEIFQEASPLITAVLRLLDLVFDGLSNLVNLLNQAIDVVIDISDRIEDLPFVATFKEAGEAVDTLIKNLQALAVQQESVNGIGVGARSLAQGLLASAKSGDTLNETIEEIPKSATDAVSSLDDLKAAAQEALDQELKELELDIDRGSEDDRIRREQAFQDRVSAIQRGNEEELQQIKLANESELAEFQRQEELAVQSQINGLQAEFDAKQSAAKLALANQIQSLEAANNQKEEALQQQEERLLSEQQSLVDQQLEIARIRDTATQNELAALDERERRIQQEIELRSASPQERAEIRARQREENEAAERRRRAESQYQDELNAIEEERAQARFRQEEQLAALRQQLEAPIEVQRQQFDQARQERQRQFEQGVLEPLRLQSEQRLEQQKVAFEQNVLEPIKFASEQRIAEFKRQQEEAIAAVKTQQELELEQIKRQNAAEELAIKRAEEDAARQREADFKERQRQLDRASAEEIAQILREGIEGATPPTSFLTGGAGGIAGGRRDGGPVEAGQVYRVGEAGPELFVSPANGYIIRKSQAEAIARQAYAPSAPPRITAPSAYRGSGRAGKDPVLKELQGLRADVKRLDKVGGDRHYYQSNDAWFKRMMGLA